MSENTDNPSKKKRGFRFRAVFLLLGLLLGLGAAAIVLWPGPTLYQSKAKLLVHYVLERNDDDKFESRTDLRGPAGEGIIRAEIDIMTTQTTSAQVST